MAYIKRQIFVLIEEGIVHADMIKPPPNCWCHCFIPTTFPKERREVQLWQCLMKRFPHFRTSGLLTILQISDGLSCTSHQLGFRLAVRRSIPEPLVWKACPGGLSHSFNSLSAWGGSNCHSWDRTLITGLQTQTLFLLFTAPGIFRSLIPKGLETIRCTGTFAAMCTTCWLKQFLRKHRLGTM